MMFKKDDLVYDSRLAMKGIVAETETSTGNFWVRFNNEERPLKLLYNRFGFISQNGFSSTSYENNTGIRKEQVTRKVSQDVYDVSYIHDPRLSVLT